MSLRAVLQKFAEGFAVTGIFLQTPQEYFPIIQKKAETLLVLKRHPSLPSGVTELNIEGSDIGVIVDALDDQTKIVILATAKNIQEVAAHWKRFLPIVKEKINIEEIISQESIETRLINRLEDIRKAIDDTTTILKEKLKFDTES